jgi:hypothetical protein
MLWKDGHLVSRAPEGKLGREAVDPFGERHVLFGQSTRIVGGEPNVDAVPNIAPLRVMVGLLGGERNAGHEGEGLVEVREAEAPCNRVPLLHPSPAGQPGERRFALLCT